MPNENAEKKQACVLMGGGDNLLLHVLLENKLEDEFLYLRLVGRKSAPPNVMRYERLDLVDPDRKVSYECTPLQQTDDYIIVKKHCLANYDRRMDLRVPIRFLSHIYPTNGKWQGRLPIRSMDLSCGGIAFACDGDLEDNEVIKVVLPLSDTPLVVRCEILHRQKLDGEEFLYCTRFVHLCAEEESLIRKAVFDLQLKNRRRE